MSVGDIRRFYEPTNSAEESPSTPERRRQVWPSASPSPDPKSWVPEISVRRASAFAPTYNEAAMEKLRLARESGDMAQLASAIRHAQSLPDFDTRELAVAKRVMLQLGKVADPAIHESASHPLNP